MILPFRPKIAALLLSCAFLGWCDAQEPLQIDQAPQNGIDTLHHYLSHKIRVFSSNVDGELASWAGSEYERNATQGVSDYFSGFFRDETFFNSHNKSYFRLRSGMDWRDREADLWVTQINFNLSLPYTQDAFDLMIGEEIEDDLEDPKRDPKAADPSVGVRWHLPRFIDPVETNFIVGVRGIDLFARGYMRLNMNFGGWRIYPVQTVEQAFIETMARGRLFEETRLFFDRRLSLTQMMRFVLRRSSDTEQLGQLYGASLSYYYSLGKRSSGLQLYSALSGDTRYFANHSGYVPSGHERTGIDTCRSGVVWKEQIWRSWLYYEIEPAIEWDRVYDYAPHYLLLANLEFWFGTY
ncbi:MAG: hypothetical protein JXK05_08640 [Campylobacterales bacterium]|nr:hypothetical protein [Campylobacterales bacterium]